MGATLARRNARAARSISRLLSKEGKALAERGQDVGDAGLADLVIGSLAKLLPRLHTAADKPGVALETQLDVANTAAKVYSAAARMAQAKSEGPLTININFPSADDAREIMARFAGAKQRRIVDMEAEPTTPIPARNGKNGKMNGRAHSG